MTKKEITIYKSESGNIKIKVNVYGNTTHTQFIWGDFISETTYKEELAEIYKIIGEYLKQNGN